VQVAATWKIQWRFLFCRREENKMALTNQDVVEGYFLDYNNRLARQNALSPERDQAQVNFSELTQAAGEIALIQSVEVEK
jgi:hypothetical protein